MKKITLGFFLSLSMLLTACGGGSASSQSQPSSQAQPSSESSSQAQPSSESSSQAQPSSQQQTDPTGDTKSDDGSNDGSKNDQSGQQQQSQEPAEPVEAKNCWVLVGLKNLWNEEDVVAPTPDADSSDVARFPGLTIKAGECFKIVWIGESQLDWSKEYGWSAIKSDSQAIDRVEDGGENKIKVNTESSNYTVTLTENYEVFIGDFGGSK